MTLRVYVAGSSAELDRVTYWMDHLEAVGVEVVYRWPSEIEAVGEPNPQWASTLARTQWATRDLAAVEDADLVWVLTPSDSPARGAYFEAGFAMAWDIPLVFSGETKQSIFSSLGTEFDSDAGAFSYVCAVHRDSTNAVKARA